MSCWLGKCACLAVAGPASPVVCMAALNPGSLVQYGVVYTSMPYTDGVTASCSTKMRTITANNCCSMASLCGTYLYAAWCAM
jgi:hypothetical protein